MNCLTLVLLLQIIFTSLLTNHNVDGQNWSTIPKWADFGFYGNWGFEDLDYKLEFILDNYEILSIEKCTGNGEGKTVRELAPLIFLLVKTFPRRNTLST